MEMEMTSQNGEEIFLTAEGAERLRAELAELSGPRREALSKRLRFAIQQGDLSENADYIAAKEEQGFLEGRIQELEYLLKNATIVENKDGQHEIVEVGAVVEVQEDDYPPETYRVVGAKEANPREGRISNESPIGRALMGHKEGDVVTVETPGGQISLTILNIE